MDAEQEYTIPSSVEEYTETLSGGLKCITIVGYSYTIICIRSDIDDTTTYYKLPIKKWY